MERNYAYEGREPHRSRKSFMVLISACRPLMYAFAAHFKYQLQLAIGDPGKPSCPNRDPLRQLGPHLTMSKETIKGQDIQSRRI